MRELIILLVIIAVIAIIWYLRSPRNQTAAKPKSDEVRGIQGSVGASDRAGGAAAATLPAAAPRGTTDTVAGMANEPAIGHLAEPAAAVTLARHDAERAAARLSSRGETALAIQTAAAAYGGALPADGTRECPPSYPIKGNATSMHYHEPDSPNYLATIAEYCFSSVEAAEAAGFSSPRREKMAASTRERQDSARAAASFFNETEARQDAERVAAGFANESAKALAIQTAAAALGGVLPGDGTRDCPSAYPIKGNASSMLFHQPGTPTYMATIAEYCFSNGEAARAAGFTSTAY
jgi:hypothetical protein